MRITFVHRTANYSGGNRVVATYAQRLLERGHRVTVVTGALIRPTRLRVLIETVRGASLSSAPGS